MAIIIPSFLWSALCSSSPLPSPSPLKKKKRIEKMMTQSHRYDFSSAIRWIRRMFFVTCLELLVRYIQAINWSCKSSLANPSCPSSFFPCFHICALLFPSLSIQSMMGRKQFFAQRDELAKKKRRERLEKSGYVFGAHAHEDAIRDKDKRIEKTKRMYKEHAELWKSKVSQLWCHRSQMGRKT